MKVVVDGYWWQEGPYSNRMVLLEIITHWTAEFPEDELVLAVPTHRRRARQPPPVLDVKIVASHLRTHPAINSIELPMIAHRESADAILAFNFAAMSKRGVVFVHDVLFQTNPAWFTRVERTYYSAMPILAHGARSVITTSASEQMRIITNNPKLRRVVHCGLAVASSLVNAEPQRPDLNLAADSFIVCVGRFNIRKNLDVTIRAIQQSGLLSAEFPLVLIGEPSGVPTGVSDFADAIANKSIVVMQRVTEGQLKWLYTNCRFFVCLSLDEGFGLPVIEAATFGAPVLASDIPVFRENLGSSGTYVRPTDTAAITAAANRMGTTPRSNAQYVAQYSWRSVCECIRDELNRVRTDSPR